MKDQTDSIAEYVAPDSGIYLVPMVRTDKDSRRFSQKQMAELKNNSAAYFWGYADGSGDSVVLNYRSFKKKYWMNRNYAAAQPILLRHPRHYTNTIENIQQFYSHAFIVDFTVNPKEDMDWGSIIFVFQKHNKYFYLRAILTNYWTI